MNIEASHSAGAFVEKRRDLTSLAPGSLTSVLHFLSKTGLEFLSQMMLTIDFLGVFA
jgi:hypothetical protein